MIEIKKLLHDHLKKARVMQLATSVNNKPWACTLHFYSDEDLNFYWISTPVRRHSQEIEKNPNVAIAIKIHEDTPTEKYVIGIAAEGIAELLSENEIEKIGNKYVDKLIKDPSILNDILSGKNPHKFYRLKATNIVLFDTKHFPDNPRQELQL